MIALITAKDPAGQPVRMVVHQLIEQGILFDSWESQTPLTAIPEDLSPFDGMIVDEDILRHISSAARKKLEKFALQKYVWIIPEHYSTMEAAAAESAIELNINLFAACAGLKCEEFPEIGDRKIIDGFIDRVRDFRQLVLPHICEYHLHFAEGAMALENTPYAPEDWSSFIDGILADVYTMFAPDGDHDQLCGGALLELYARRRNDPEILNKLFSTVDTLLENRPRSAEGIVSMGGNRHDPLFFNGIDTPFFGNNGYTVAGRDLVNNELFHYYGGLFAACAAAGKPHLFAEAMKIMEHIDRVHRDKDGLFFHASRKSQAFGSKWCRGNTHALLGAFYMLRRYPGMPDDCRIKVVKFLKKSLDALQRVQSTSGLWHNILDDPSTPLETSSGVLITYIYSWCINQGLIAADDAYIAMISRCRKALKRKFWHGYGSGNCTGTMPAADNPGYYRRRRMHLYAMPLIAPALIESAKLLNLK